MTKTTKRTLWILGVLIALLAIIFIVLLIVAEVVNNPDTYTEQQHIERINERVKKSTRYKYDSFDVYPLYDENDKIQFYLIEFEPSGFIYVQLTKWSMFNYIFSCGTPTSMYMDAKSGYWYRYTVDENSHGVPLEVDEDGEVIYYEYSHYKAASIKDEKLYLLETCKKHYRIPAVKRGDGYLNLISMTEVIIVDGVIVENQAADNIYVIPKRHFEL